MSRTLSRRVPVRWMRLVLVSALLAACDGGDAPTASPSVLPGGSRPSILLFSLDTTRADALGCYGSDRGASPALDALAAQGVLFEQAFAPVPMTLPSHATMLTGLLPPRHGVRDNSIYQLPAGAQTLAESLGAAGYRTFATVAAVVLGSGYGLDQGFDVYDERGLTVHGDSPRTERPADEILAAFVEHLDGARPFFGFVHFYDPHQPLTPPEDLRARFAGDLYHGEIAAVDRAIAGALAALEARGLREDTVIIVTADHGEGRGEHFELSHGTSLHDATQRIPLLLAHPRLAPRRVPGQIATLADLVPTLLDLAGVPQDRSLDGRSLVPALRGEEAREPGFAYLETMNTLITYDWAPLFGVRTLEWKLVVGSRPHLFHLTEDPGENADVSLEHEDVVKRLRATLQELQRGAGPALPSENRAVSGAELRVLGGLGYFSSEVVALETEGTGRPDPWDNAEQLLRFKTAVQAMHERHFTEACAVLEDLARRFPGTCIVRQNLARCYGELGQRERAYEESLAALELRPDSGMLCMNAGFAALESGRIEEGEELLLEATRRTACPPRAFLVLADRYREAGRTAEARALLTEVLQHPDLLPRDRESAAASLEALSGEG